jgi:hypothetical protein
MALTDLPTLLSDVPEYPQFKPADYLRPVVEAVQENETAVAANTAARTAGGLIIEKDFTLAEIQALGAVLTGSIAFDDTLADGHTVVACGVRASEAAAGTSMSAFTVQMFAGADDFSTAKDVYTGASGSEDAADENAVHFNRSGAAETLTAKVTSTGCNLEDAAAGAFTAWIAVV